MRIDGTIKFKFGELICRLGSIRFEQEMKNIENYPIQKEYKMKDIKKIIWKFIALRKNALMVVKYYIS